MRNTIQIFGLPRSGTNLLEWAIQEYYEDIYYENKYQVNDIEFLCEYGKKIALKHSMPVLLYSQYALVIYKEYQAWLKSYRKRCRLEITPEDYAEYLKDLTLRSITPRVKVVEHQYLCHNFEKVIRDTAIQFNLKLQDKEIIYPTGYMTKHGARAYPRKNKHFRI